MKKITLPILLVFFCATSLQAQITQEQANTIVFQYLQAELTQPYLLYVYYHEPSADEILLTTYNEEVIKVKYPCWAYYLNENSEISEPCQHRYLFVKANDGNLLEVITSNDLGQTDLTEWTLIEIANPDISNATLSTLSVSEGELEPAFSSNILNYTLNVVEQENITITATATNSNATVTDIGTFELEIGQNSFTVNVMAEDGVTELDYTIIINNVLDVSEIIDSYQITIFPNPTTGELQITNYELQNGLLSAVKVEVFDVYGRKQKAESRKDNVVDISNLFAGIYFVKISTEAGTITKKIIKH